MTEKCKKCSMKDLCICIPSTDECHVRKQSFNKAIDGFAEKMKEVGIENNYHCSDYYAEDCNWDCDKCKYDFEKDIDEIAEEMKGGAE